jgi:hypothetical protein
MNQVLDRPQAHTLAVLPDGATGPEGLTVGPDGNYTSGPSATTPKARSTVTASSTSSRQTAI